MPRRNRVMLSVLCLVLFALLNGCGGPPPGSNSSSAAKVEPKTTGTRGGKLTYRVTAPPKSFNYLMAADEPTIVTAFYMLTSRLVEFDHRTKAFVPGLAESWTTADGKTVDVKLREGLKFSDGDDLKTDDVIWTLEAIYDERTKSPAWRDAMVVDDKPIATKRISDREMQLIFPKAVASVENYMVNIGVLPSHILDAEQKAGKLAEAWKINAPPASIVSSGPFTVEAATPGERIDYARNPNYWRKDEKGVQLPYVDKFSVEIIPDANNTFVRLNQGTLDIADRIRPTDHVELTKSPGQMRAIDAGPGLGIDHMWFNLNTADPSGKPLDNQIKRAWFADKRFRQAVAMAIDRKAMTVNLQGLATALHGFVSPANSIWLDPNLPKIDYDVAKAEQLLANAGFKKGGTAEAPVLTDAQNNPVEFTLIVPAENEPRKSMAAIIQQDMAKLGIKMQVVPVEFAKVLERSDKTYDYDAILFGMSQTDLEPSSYQNFLLSSAATHQWQPEQKTPATEWEARIDKLFAEQASELDKTKRLAAFHEIQKIMREEMPVIPLAARHVAAAAHTRVGNYSPSSIMPYSLWNVEELFVR